MKDSSADEYRDPSERRLYVADISRIEIYGTKETSAGKIINKYRTAISPQELLGQEIKNDSRSETNVEQKTRCRRA